MNEKTARTHFCVQVVDRPGGSQLASGIQVSVPAGLTLDEAAAYVAGYVAGEFRRYAAYKALGVLHGDSHRKVT